MLLASRFAPICMVLAVAIAAAGDSHASLITVDGAVSDWGIVVGDGDSSDWYNGPKMVSQATKTLGSGLEVTYMVDDTQDGSGLGQYLGPQYGGQDYDAEFLGVASDSGKLLLLIVTGQRSDNPFANFSPGDIRIETSAGVYGIEVGGGAGNPSVSAPTFVEGAAGTTYKIFNNGHTKELLTTNAAQTAGSVWLNPTWITNSPISPTFDVQMVAKGTSVGLADYIYKPVGNQHAVIEVAIDYSFFGVGTTVNRVAWAPSCGNDLVSVNNMNLDLQAVPEPSSIVAFGAVFASWGLGMVVKKRRRRVE